MMRLRDTGTLDPSLGVASQAMCLRPWSKELPCAAEKLRAIHDHFDIDWVAL
jgi:hypothetical protein